MGLENCEPLTVLSTGGNNQSTNSQSYNTVINGSGDLSPRTAKAIAESMADMGDFGERRDEPVVVDDDDDDFEFQPPLRRGPEVIDLDDPVPMALDPASPWNTTTSLIDRMTALNGDNDLFNLRIPHFGESGLPEGYLGPGKFEAMAITGTQKTSFLQLLNDHVVTPYNWRIGFPSKAMGSSCPLHYPNSRIEDALQDAKQQKMFVAVHIFNKQSESSDFYNMIISREDVQSAYAESFIPYFVSMDSAVELSALTRLISPSLQRRPPPLPLPMVLFLATMKSRTQILGAADSQCDSGAYLQKLFLLRESYIPELRQEEELEKARQEEARLISEQNLDYEMAVKQDEEKAKQEEELAAIAALEEQERQEAIDAALKYAEDQAKIQSDNRVSQRKRYIDALASLPAEPTEGKNATIALRLADGSKVQRKFNPDTTTLADVFTFAAAQSALKATDENFSLPNNSDLPWSIAHFDLSAQFPARRFSHSQENQTLRQLGLVGQELLNLVENN